MTPSAPLTGMLFSAAAYLLFTCFDTVTKYLSRHYSVFEIMSVEFLTATALLTAFALLRGQGNPGPGPLRMHRPYLHITRGAFQIAGQSLTFLALPHLSLAEFYIIVFCMPAVAVLKAGWFLKERAAWHIWPVIAVNFAGVLIAMRPDHGVNIWALAALAGVVLLGGSLVVLRKMGESETPEMCGVSTGISLALGALAVTPFVYSPMEPKDIALMMLAGALFAPAQMLLITAFRMAPVALASPPQFLQLAYGAAAGYAIFGDVPGPAIYFGGATVIAANAALIYIENGKSRLPACKLDGCAREMPD